MTKTREIVEIGIAVVVGEEGWKWEIRISFGWECNFQAPLSTGIAAWKE